MLVASLTACRMSAAEPAGALSELTVGVLGGSCDADRVTALRQAGVRLVEVGVEWSRFEPAPQQFDQAYIDDLRARFARCAAAGLGVVPTPGFQYAPDWVVELPDGTYLDQYGNSNPARAPNYVFSATVRDAVERYLDRFSAEFPLDGFAAIRVGTSEAGNSASRAVNSAPRATASGPSTTPRSPATGSPPDAAEPDARLETRRSDLARPPARRCSHPVMVRLVRRRGGPDDDLADRPPARAPLPWPDPPATGRARGAAADLAAATAAALDGTADRDGSLERGLFYPDQLRTIAAATDPDTLFADVTGVDDATAVAARQLDPPQDTCQPSDASLPLRAATSVDTWSATRWTVANARAAGLRVVGENPGHPDTPGTGGDGMSDDLAAQLVHAPRYAQECGLEVLLWAFEDDLFGPHPEVWLDDLARRIHE